MVGPKRGSAVLRQRQLTPSNAGLAGAGATRRRLTCVHVLPETMPRTMWFSLAKIAKRSVKSKRPAIRLEDLQE
jgi:hypothetical protein